MINFNKDASGQKLRVNFNQDISSGSIFKMYMEPQINGEVREISPAVLGTSDVMVGDEKFLANQYLEYTIQADDFEDYTGIWRVKGTADGVIADFRDYHAVYAGGGEIFVDTPFILDASIANIVCKIQGIERPERDLIRSSDTRLTFTETIPLSSTFGGDFNENQNADWANGSDVGTLVGTASVDDSYIKNVGITGNYVSWSATANADHAVRGAIRLKIIPLYSGSPSGDPVFYHVKQFGSDNNSILIFHNNDPSGSLLVKIYDQAGVNTIYGAGSWLPTAGEEYEFEFNYDFSITLGEFFINGIKTSSFAPVKTLNPALMQGMYCGTISQSSSSNFWCNSIMIFNAIQHSTDYVVKSFPLQVIAGDLIEVWSGPLSTQTLSTDYTKFRVMP